MQHRINKADFHSHYLKIFILLKFYVDFLQKLRKIEKVYNLEKKVEKRRFADMNSDIQFSIGDTYATVTDARGNPKIFSFTDDTRLDITNGGHTTRYEFNDDHLITKIEYPEGNSVTYSYYPAKENERRSPGNLEPVVRWL
jgi:hypothetical protein